ncbi:MAG: 2-C-methyl-D-erythritol 4-phosphate cytidylyltransferase [Gemmatimonadota bacterium]
MILASAVLVAGGQGRRMGGDPKQFRLLGDRPTVCWAARALFDALDGPLVVALPDELAAEGERLLRVHLPDVADRLRVVVGGPRRQDSVHAGLGALDNATTVLVHDAARPFASPVLVERVARRAASGRAVIPAVPIRDTLKEVDGDRIVGTRDRSRFVAAQTPQGFPLAVLRAAHQDALGEEATDDAALCERRGVEVTWMAGERLNRKLTDPEDWAWAEQALAAGWVRWQ